MGEIPGREIDPGGAGGESGPEQRDRQGDPAPALGPHRMDELEVGIDGTYVYRQEFFAWAYAIENPLNFLGGVGLGQYNDLFLSRFGPGAGYTIGGALAPLNSVYFETSFDLGGFFTSALYILLGALVLLSTNRVKRFLTLALLFLIIQKKLSELSQRIVFLLFLI